MSAPISIRCPWIEEHSCDSGPTETVYFPAGTGGMECGHFKCLHASHAGKTDADFLDAIGYLTDGFVDERTAVDHTPLSGFAQEGETPAVVVMNPLDLPRFDRQPKTNKIKPHVNNLLLFVNWLCEQGEGIRYDTFRDEIILTTRTGSRPFVDADYMRLRIRAEMGQAGFAPLSKENVRDVVHMVAQDRCFDSAKEWIAGLPAWDGVPRVATFCPVYLGSTSSPYTVAVSRYLWSAMAGRILSPGVKADMSLILVSPQGTGKSAAVRAMAPTEDWYLDLHLNERDAELSRMTRGKTLCELCELRGLHTKEMESIKAFVTRLEAEWIPKYFEMRTVYKRRFLMIGTTNSDEFLGDVTGERRWLPLRVDARQRIDWIARDHDQLWAEGMHLYHEYGIIWQDAQSLATEQHAEFSTHDVMIDQLQRWLNTPEFGRTPSTCDFLHLYDVMKDGLGYDARDITRPNQMRVGDALRRLGYTPVQRWINGTNNKVWIKRSSDLRGEVDRELL